MSLRKITTKKTKITLISCLAAFLTFLLVLSGVGIYFAFNKKTEQPELIVNPIGFSMDKWDGKSVSAAEYVPAYAGRSNNTITIDSAQSFIHFINQANSGETFEGKTVYLNCSVDMAGYTINSIKNFKGTFDGGFYNILNAKINGTALFEKTENATIKNIGLYNCITNKAGLIETAINTNIEFVFVRAGEINGLETAGLVGNAQGIVNISNSFADSSDVTYGLIGDTSLATATLNVCYYTHSDKPTKNDNVTQTKVVYATYGEEFLTWNYSKRMYNVTDWCAYSYIENSQKLEFKFPVQSGFVKVYNKGSYYEGVVKTNSGFEDFKSLSQAFSIAQTGTSTVNLIVEKIVTEAEAVVNANTTVAITSAVDTVIERGVDNKGSIFSATASGSKLIIGDGLTLDGNKTYVEENNLKSGSLITAYNNNLSLGSDIILQNNKNTETAGGALLVYNNTTSNQNFNLSDLTVNNCSSAGDGGAICFVDMSVNLEGVSVSNCYSQGNGGAISITTSKNETETVSYLSSNYGINNLRKTADDHVVVTDSYYSGSLNGNYSTENGGGIYCAGSSLHVTLGSRIENCSSEMSGGGIYCKGNLTISDESGVEGCRAQYDGGGVYCGGALDMSMSDLIGNTAARFFGDTAGSYGHSGYGGGAYVGDDLRMLNAYIRENGGGSLTAETTCYGGAVYVEGDISGNIAEFTDNTIDLGFWSAIYAGGDINLVGNILIEGSLPMQECASVVECVGNATFSDLTMEKCYVGNDEAGLICSGGDLTINNSRIEDCDGNISADLITVLNSTINAMPTTDGYGSHIVAANVIISDSTISSSYVQINATYHLALNNSTLSGNDYDGGYDSDDSVIKCSKLTMNNSIIDRCGNYGGDGYPIIDVTGDASITSSSITNCNNYGSILEIDGKVEIYNSHLDGNDLGSTDGPGTPFSFGGDYKDINIANTTFNNNYGNANSGYQDDALIIFTNTEATNATLNLVNLEFNNNAFNAHSIIKVEDSKAALDVVLTNCTFNNNEGNYPGWDSGDEPWWYLDKVLDVSGVKSLTLNNCEIKENEITAESALYVNFPTTLNSTIISDNYGTTDAGARGIYASGAALTLTDSTIEEHIMRTSYNADEDELFVGDGGGIYLADSSTLTLTNSTIQNNGAHNGGGIYIESGSTITLDGATFISNTAFNSSDDDIGINENYGGAIYSVDAITINNSTFKQNYAGGNYLDGYGGAIYSQSSITVENNSVFDRNHSWSAGGALYAKGTITIEDSSFAYNSTEGYNGGNGGAIYTKASVSVINSNFTNNHTLTSDHGGISNGGAIYASGATINSSVFDGNNCSTGSGGAIYSNGSVTANKSTFTGNSVDNSSSSYHGDVDGGAIYSTGTVEVRNSTISNNLARGNGGAIYSGSKATIYSSDISGGTATSDGGAIYASSVDVQYSTFSGCSAKKLGGAVYSSGNITTWQSKFEENWNDAAQYEYTNEGGRGEAIYDVSSETKGGALYASGGVLVRSSEFYSNGLSYSEPDCTFYTNSGGAIYAGGSTTIESSTFGCNGYLSNTIKVTKYGGAVYSVGAVTVTNSHFKDVNDYGSSYISAASYGGAIYCKNTTTITGSTFSNIGDEYYAVDGGAVYSEKELNITDATFSACVATNGGAAYSKTYITVDGSLFSQNSATKTGGAVRAGTYVTITDSIFTDNETTLNESSAHGGAVWAQNYITATDSEFLNNTSGCYGGALATGSNSTEYTTTISNCVINGNTAGVGGGVRIRGKLEIKDNTIITNNKAVKGNLTFVHGGGVFGGQDTTITNSVIAYNTSEGAAGGVEVVNADATLTVSGSTIYGNTSAGNGAGLYTTGAIILNNKTVISNNTSSSAGGGAYAAKTITANDVVISHNSAIKTGGGLHANTTASLDSVTIIGNKTTSTTNTNGGAGVYAATSITIQNSTITQNESKALGGGVLSNGTAEITNSNISENTASIGGGAIWCNTKATIKTSTLNNNKTAHDATSAIAGGGAVMAELFEIEDTYLNGNSSGYYGGAIHTRNTGNQSGYTSTIKNSEICNNTAVFGGGLNVRTLLKIENCYLAGNISTNADAEEDKAGGGAIDAWLHTEIKNSTFENNLNTGTNPGGAIRARQTLDLQNSYILNNESYISEGAAIAAAGSTANAATGYVLKITNSVISGNGVVRISDHGYDEYAAADQTIIYSRGAAYIEGSYIINNGSFYRGAIINSGNNLTIRTSEISKNQSYEGYMIGTSGSLAIYDSAITDNGTEYAWLIKAGSTLTVSGSSILYNRINTSGFEDDANRFIKSSGDLTITSSDISHNNFYGGGKFIETGSDDIFEDSSITDSQITYNSYTLMDLWGTATITRTNIINNKNLSIYALSKLELNHCSVVYNEFISSLAADGEGVHITNDCDISYNSGTYLIHALTNLSNSTISNNLFLQLIEGYKAEIRNSQIINNEQSVWQDEWPNSDFIMMYGTITIVNSQINNNHKVDHADIKGTALLAISESATISNTEFVGNMFGELTDCIVGGDLTFKDCLVSDNNSQYTIKGANITISNSTLSNNGHGYHEANYAGGAVHATGNLTINADSDGDGTKDGDGTFIINNVANGDGGGVYAKGTATISDATISNNIADGYYSDGKFNNESDEQDGKGGGIYANIVILNNVVVSDNYAEIAGGGIYAADYAIIRNSRIENNTKPNYTMSYSAHGGGGVFATNYAEIYDSYIANNYSDYYGGGVYINNKSDTASSRTSIIDNTTIINNKAHTDIDKGYGGGIYVRTNIEVRNNSVISYNSAGAGSGGIQGINNVTVKDSIISHNTAGTRGGGLRANAGGTITIENSDITFNTAVTYGGGIYAYGPLVVTNSNISNNQAGLNGAGLMGANGITITGSTISGNSLEADLIPENTQLGGFGNIEVYKEQAITEFAGGGGIAFEGGSAGDDVTITDCKIFGNSAGDAADGYRQIGGGIYRYLLDISDDDEHYTNNAIDSVTITNTEINNNIGEGIYFRQIKSLSITGGTISNNTKDGISSYVDPDEDGNYEEDNDFTNLKLTNIKINNNAYGVRVWIDYNEAIISGCNISNNAYTGVHFYHYNSSATITDSIINNNNAGGIRLGTCDNGGQVKLTLSNSTVSGNSSTGDGAGVLVESYSANATIEDCIITNNISGNNGGGICIDGGECADLNLIDSSVTNNTASNQGGGIWLESHYPLTTGAIAGSIISGNTAYIGGGLYYETEDCSYDWNGDVLSILGSKIYLNKATLGAGVYVREDYTVSTNTISFEIVDSAIYANEAVAVEDNLETTEVNEAQSGLGGGLYLDGLIKLQLNNTGLVYANYADQGEDIYFTAHDQLEGGNNTEEVWFADFKYPIEFTGESLATVEEGFETSIYLVYATVTDILAVTTSAENAAAVSHSFIIENGFRTSIDAVNVVIVADGYSITISPNGGAISYTTATSTTGFTTEALTLYVTEGNARLYTDSTLAVAITAFTFQRNGYVANGIYNEATGGAQVIGVGYATFTSPWYATDTTYFVQWNLNVYTITYNLDGGVLTENNPSTYTVETETITLNNPTKEGFTFVGWVDANSNPVSEIAVGSYGNIELTATWEAATFTVTWKDGDTTVETDPEVAYGIAPSYDGTALTKASSIFLGWTLNGTDIINLSEIKVTSNLELNAKYHTISIVSSNNEHGTVSIAQFTNALTNSSVLTENGNVLKVDDEDVIATANLGYAFKEWQIVTNYDLHTTEIKAVFAEAVTVSITANNAQATNTYGIVVVKDGVEIGRYSSTFELVKGEAYTLNLFANLIASPSNNNYQLFTFTVDGNSNGITYNAGVSVGVSVNAIKQGAISENVAIVFNFTNANLMKVSYSTPGIIEGVQNVTADNIELTYSDLLGGYLIPTQTEVIGFSVNTTNKADVTSTYYFTKLTYTTSQGTFSQGYSEIDKDVLYVSDNEVVYNYTTELTIKELVITVLLTTDPIEISTSNWDKFTEASDGVTSVTLKSQEGHICNISSADSIIRLYESRWDISIDAGTTTVDALNILVGEFGTVGKDVNGYYLIVSASN